MCVLKYFFSSDLKKKKDILLWSFALIFIKRIISFQFLNRFPKIKIIVIFVFDVIL